MSKPLNLHAGSTTIAKDPLGILLAKGTTVPADGSANYHTGCLFIKLNGGDGTALYVNEGTRTSCDFNALNGA